MKAVALVSVLVANLLAFYHLQMQPLLQLLLKLQEQEAEIMVNLQEISNLKKKRRRIKRQFVGLTMPIMYIFF